jgi:glycerophosphoryl diester phosphodiesterase
MTNAPDWLVALPIAHRGLHDKHNDVIENSISAAQAAISRGFAIECDIQRSADGEAVVFHDEALERLTAQSGLVETFTSTELRQIDLLGTRDTIPTLNEFLALINGRVPLICEIKSGFQGDTQLAERANDIVRTYSGPLAFKSFDPDMLRRLRALGCPRPLGIIAEAVYDDPEWDMLTQGQKRDMANLVHYPETKPDFLSFWVRDLPSAASVLFRHGLNLPVMAWTVRTPEQRAHAALHANQMVFEGFIP